MSSPTQASAIALLRRTAAIRSRFFRDLYSELLRETAGVEMPADAVPPEPPLAVDPSAYAGLYEREGASIRVQAKDGGLVAVQTTTGLGSELTPDPVELPLRRVAEDDDLFLTEHPAAPGMAAPGPLRDARRPRDPGCCTPPGVRPQRRATKERSARASLRAQRVGSRAGPASRCRWDPRPRREWRAR